MMGAGFHGYNGVNPCLSVKLLSTQMYPRFLFRFETLNLQQKELVNKYSKKVLKPIRQHLPDRTADEVVSSWRDIHTSKGSTDKGLSYLLALPGMKALRKI